MTDRVKGLMVTLQRDIREDDIEAWVQAIRLMRGVESVTLIESDAWNDDMVERRTMERIKSRIDDLFSQFRKSGIPSAQDD